VSTAIVLFRRDLRLADNPALVAACAKHDRILPTYIHAPDEQAPWAPGAASRWWLHHGLEALHGQLAAQGGDLHLLAGDTLDHLRALIRANDGYARGYGGDEITARVTAQLREVFDAPDAAPLDPAELAAIPESAWERARSEAKKFFGDDEVYLEKAILKPRHVEIQVLGDRDGNLVHVFERDCSIQRRNQKVVEETPSPAASRALVEEMGRIAVQGAKAVGYHSAGTFEFLVDDRGGFYFLEMNTRLQVEHPVTELVTGLDLVREMVLIAQGEPLTMKQEDLSARGAAIECRIYAEDPSAGYLPSPGTIERLSVPSGPGVRDDGGAYAGCTISSFYDPLISKLSVWAPTRERAVARMRRALSEYVVTGIRTNLAFHQRLFEHPEFVAGRYDTGFLDRHADQLVGYPTVPDGKREAVAVAVALAASRIERATGTVAAQRGETGARLAPWVAAHRARLR